MGASAPLQARDVRRALERIHPAARRPLADQLQAVVVVGRDRELTRFDAWFQRGAQNVVLLEGEAGAGKSSLLSELAGRAALAGASAVSLSCGALEGPGALIRPLLVRWAAEAGAELANEIPSASARAAMTAASAAVAEADLDELAGVAADLAGRSKRNQLVLLDDVERLDSISRAWIRKLACREPRVSIRWVLATARGGSAADEDALLVETGFAERLLLSSLDHEGVARLVGARLGDTPPEDLLAFLWSKAAGHAGLTIELLRAAAAAGAVVEDDAGLRAVPEKLAALGVPPDFESSLLARFAALPVAARTLAEALAIAGLPLGAEGIRLLVPDADVEALATLRSAGLAREVEGGSWLIWPPAIGERLASTVERAEAQRLHRLALELPGLSAAERFRHPREAGKAEEALRAAEAALEEMPDDRLAEVAAELAEKISPVEAARWHEKTARLRMARRRYAAAVPHIERALELEPTGDARAERWAALVTCLLNSGRYQETGAAIQKAIAEGVPPEIRARLLADDAARLSAVGRMEEALSAFRLAEKEASSAQAPFALAVALEGIALIEFFRRQFDAAEAARAPNKLTSKRTMRMANYARSSSWPVLSGREVMHERR